MSILGVCLVVAIGQMLSNQMATFNFEMVYDEYREFLQKQMRMGRGMGQLHFAKPVALKVFKRLTKAFEGLADIGILIFNDNINSINCPKEYRMARSMLSRHQIINALDTIPTILPDAIKKWMGTV